MSMPKESEFTIHDLIGKVAAQHPNADITDTEELADEVEDEARQCTRTVDDVLDLYRPLLTHSLDQLLRGRTRRVEQEAIPSIPAGPRTRTDRAKPTIVGAPPDGYQRHNIEELRQRLSAEGVARLLEQRFRPARKEELVKWKDATIEQHQMRIRSQTQQGDAVYADAYRHELFVQAIQWVEGAKTFVDVMKVWKKL